MWPGVFTAGLGNALTNPEAMTSRPNVWIQPFHPPGTLYTMMLFEYEANAVSPLRTLNWLVVNSPPMEPHYDADEFEEIFAYRRPESPIGDGGLLIVGQADSGEILADDGASAERTYVFLVLRQAARVELVDEVPVGECDTDGRQIDVDAFMEQYEASLYQGAFFRVGGGGPACCESC